MQRILAIITALLMVSCAGQPPRQEESIITVSIPPYKYFVEAIGGSDFQVNVMVPAGSNPHIYEPFPGQITELRRSVAYISNGFLGFEMTWLDRFYEANTQMEKLNLGASISPIESDEHHHHEGEHAEGADPHYWVSPRCALSMALPVKDLLTKLRPERSSYYTARYDSLVAEIHTLDKLGDSLFSSVPARRFMIYHPNLAYLARDYGLEEVAVEFEGKEPSPARMKDLIDLSRETGISTIFVQKEYDTKNARAIASETGSTITIIDPLSENWFESTRDIILALHNCLNGGTKY